MSMTETQMCLFCSEPIPADSSECPHCGESLGSPTRESVFDDQMAVDQMLLGEVDGFVAAYVRGAELSGAYLSGADLFGANLVVADLKGADLGGANLVHADLTRADLRRANLFAADLSDAQLAGTDLRGADLRAADLSGAIYDDCTRWPIGFDPELAGAIHAFARG